jgi:hypothetical protein
MNEWTEMFSNWLKEGKEDSESLLDIPWDLEIKKVEGTENDLIVATHPKIPFNIEVVVSKHYANLVINPIVPTDALDVPERMRLYKKLLHLNTDLNLMKAGLVGYDDNPVIQVDLDLNSLSKQEFNDALTLLVVGAHNLIKILDLTKEMEEYMVNKYKAIVSEKLAAGESKEQILEFLTERAGLQPNDAKAFLEQMIALLEKNGKAPKDEGPSPGPMYV